MCSSAAVFSGLLLVWLEMWPCKQRETAAKLPHQRQLSHIPTWRHSAFFCSLCWASCHWLKSCFLRYVFVCIFLHPSTALKPQAVWVFSRNSHVEKNRYGRVCDFLFYTSMSDVRKKKGGKIRERCLDAIPSAYNWDKKFVSLECMNTHGGKAQMYILTTCLDTEY